MNHYHELVKFTLCLHVSSADTNSLDPDQVISNLDPNCLTFLKEIFKNLDFVKLAADDKNMYNLPV